eukprot:5408868-Ditylum_brightwellii.AAC.1
MALTLAAAYDRGTGDTALYDRGTGDMTGDIGTGDTTSGTGDRGTRDMTSTDIAALDNSASKLEEREVGATHVGTAGCC